MNLLTGLELDLQITPGILGCRNAHPHPPRGIAQQHIVENAGGLPVAMGRVEIIQRGVAGIGDEPQLGGVRFDGIGVSAIDAATAEQYKQRGQC
ncbi:hypothetical protein D3C75_1084010 [compost metagenome]